MRYRLIAVDMDGTLLNSEGKITKKTMDAIRSLNNTDIIFTISTGRPIHGVKKYNNQLLLTGPIITYNGAMIVNAETQEILFEEGLKREDAEKILELGERADVTMCIWSNNQLYGNRLDNRIHDYKKLSGVEPLLADKEQLLNQGITKILWYDDIDRIQQFCRDLSSETFSQVTFCTSKPIFLEFFSSKVSKAIAMEKIGELYNIRREEMIAIGDGLNDLSMIEYAGLGVAMGNAEQAVKDRAQYITASNNEDGVAQVIETFCHLR